MASAKNNYIVLGIVASGFDEFAKRLHGSLGPDQYQLINAEDHRFYGDSKEHLRPSEEYKANILALFSSDRPFIFAAGFDQASNEVARALISRFRPTVIRINEVSMEATVTDMLTRWKRRLNDLHTVDTCEHAETPEKLATQIFYLTVKGGFNTVCENMDTTMSLAKSNKCTMIAATKKGCEALFFPVSAGCMEAAPVAPVNVQQTAMEFREQVRMVDKVLAQ